MGDEQHKLGPHELEGTHRRRGGGKGDGVPAGVAGVAQGTTEEESRGGCRGSDGKEDQQQQAGSVVGQAPASSGRRRGGQRGLRHGRADLGSGIGSNGLDLGDVIFLLGGQSVVETD